MKKGGFMRASQRSRCHILFLVIILFFTLQTLAFSQELDREKILKGRIELRAALQHAGISLGSVTNELTEDQKKTLASIKKINDYPIYTMAYHGDYGFDEFIEVGHPWDPRSSTIREGCSCFGALNKKGQIMYGRNLDLSEPYSVLVLYTHPPDGYASVSLCVAVDIDSYLENPTDENTQWVLEYPYWPFDGMNEYGVSISGLNVDGEVVYDPDKISLDRYEFRRLVLDHARNVNEAIDLIRKYNNTGSETVHYLISDAQGKSAIVEYYDGQVHAHRNVEPWQAVTNFMIGGAPPDSLLGHCERYAAVYTALHNFKGLITPQIGMDILGSVARYMLPVGDGRYIYTVWSAIYDLTDGGLNVCPGTEYGNLEKFNLDMVRDLKLVKSRISPKKLQKGDKFELITEIKNNSPRPSKVTIVRYYLSKKKIIDENAILLAKRSFKSLRSKKKRALQIERYLKKTIEPGTYFFVTVVDEAGHNNDPKPKNNKFVWEKKVIIK
jgi:hypothetical protein